MGRLTEQNQLYSFKIGTAMIINVWNVGYLLQPRESKLRTKDNAKAHKSSSEFEIAALFQIIKERQFQIQSYFYELEHYPSS